jgi:gliding motility-associated-like protein
MKNKYNFFIIIILIALSKLSFGQVIYLHSFGTTTFSAANPYTVAPTTIDPALSGSQWATNLAAGFNSSSGLTGQALSLSNSNGSPTYSLSYNISGGFLNDVTAFSFWSKRSGTGAPNWTLTINGITVGAGTTPTAGIATGTVAVSNAVNGLSGTAKVVLTLSGGTSTTGTYRIDDFTLYGSVYSTCTPPATQATALVSSALTSTSASLNWTAGSGGNVIVLAHQSSAVNASPLSGTVYAANAIFALGQQIGTGNYVVYNGTGTSVNVTGLTAGTDYYFSVFEYNSAGTCYLIPGLTGSLTTVACTPPSIQSSLFTYSAITNTSGTVSWTSGNGGNAIVLAHQTSTVNASPVNGVAYTANSVFGTGQQIGVGNYVVFNGAGNSVNVTGLNPGTDYQFAVFEYNSGTDCYLSPALTGSIVTTNTVTIGANCLKIKSILVEACGAPESYNEMVYFQNGSNPLPIDQISIAGAPTSGVYALNKWPNAANNWNGLVQNATTVSNVAAINSSITACGYILEPPQTAGIGIIPPFANVILVGSAAMTPSANRFDNLTDTVYMVFQTFATTTGGHFVNYTAGSGTRSFVIIDNLHSCTSNSVTYQPGQLTHLGNGDGVSYDDFNNITYFNSGCKAPYVGFTVAASPSQTICYNGQAVVTASPSGIYNSLIWSGGTGVFSSPTSLTTTYTPGATETGTVQLQCSITRTCASNSFSAAAVTTVSIISLPTFVLSATNVNLCPSATTSMSYAVTNAANAGVITPNWSSPAATTSTYLVSAPSSATPVTYSLNLTNVCGTTLETFTVYPLESPTVTLSSTTPAACVGNTLSLTATGNTNNFSWNNPVSSGPTVTLTANTTTTGIVTSTNSCGTSSDTYTLTVTQNPTIIVDNPSPTLCAGQSATITATSSSGTYTWSPDAVNTNSIVVNSVGTHTVFTSNVCNSASVAVNVVVNAVATLSISTTSNSLCTGGQVTATLSVGTPGTYSWSTGAHTPTLAISSPGIYTATVDAGFCGFADNTITIETLPTPTLSIVSTSSLLCDGATATITASSNLNNFSWSNGATNTPTIVVTAASLYSVFVTNACGTPSASVNILTAVTPTLNVVSTSSAICSGSTATLSVTGGIEPYTWSNSVLTGSTVTTNGGTVNVTYSNSCGTDTKIISVSIIPNPTVTLTSNSYTVCPGDVINIVANSTEGNYSWSGSANTTATLALIASASTTGTVTTTNACTSAIDNYTINVIAVPTLTIDLTNVSLCTGESVTLTAASSESTYTWQPSGVNTNTIVANSTQIYTVTTSNSCYTVPATSTVSINSSPTLTISSTSPSLCPAGQTATLSITGSGGTYNWSDGNNNDSTIVNTPGVYTTTVTTANCGSVSASYTIAAATIPTIMPSFSSTLLCDGAMATLSVSTNMANEIWSDGSTNTNTIVVNTAGIYTVGVSNACGSPTVSITIQTNTTPTLVLVSSSNTLCPNQTATLTVTGGNSPYIWSNNSSNTGSVVTTSGGTVSVTYSNVCGIDTQTVTVTTSSVTAGITANPASGITPLTVNFTNNSNGAIGYAWTFGNGNTAITQTVVAQTYTAVGSFMAYLMATDGTCFDTDSVLIHVLNEAPTLIIPNVFTPNSDSVNDIFRVTGTNIIDFNCTIFDRWGLQMFYWDNIKSGWDGKADGKEVPAGTYFYIINAKDIDGIEIKKQGHLSLFR